MFNNFKLITNVNTNNGKEKNPIKEKFAKLTLSSNKKKDESQQNDLRKCTKSKITYSSSESDDNENYPDHGPSEREPMGNKRQSSDSDATFCTTLGDPLPTVEPIETQMEKLEISQSQDTFANTLNNTVTQLSNQIKNITISNVEKIKDDDTVPNTSQGSASPLTISSASESHTSSSFSNVIEILDSEEEAGHSSSSSSKSVDTTFENVSPLTSPAAKSNLNSVSIQKLNEFFDNIPDAQSPVKSISKIQRPPPSHILAPLSEHDENVKNNTNNTEQSINVSETASGEKSSEKHDASQLSSSKRSEEKIKNTASVSSEESEQQSESDSEKENDVANAKMYPSKINISAKVAIKIQLSDSFTESESSNAVSSTSGGSGSDLVKPKCSIGEVVVVHEASELHERSQPSSNEAPMSPRSSPLSTSSKKIIATPEHCSDKNSDKSFILNAEHQALLDELYGNTWKTPATLKKCKINEKDMKSVQPPPPSARHTDVGFHDDFTLHRRNIDTDLESTRISDTESKKTSHDVPAAAAAVPLKLKDTEIKSPAAVVTSPFFKKPNRQTKETKTSSTVKKVPRSCRKAIRIIESDSDTTDEWNGSDENDALSVSSDSDGMEKKQKVRRNASNKIIYLDLSYVEAQEDVKHKKPMGSEKDLEEISQAFLKSFEEEQPTVPTVDDEVKTPNKPIQPTKRKLFTPNYDAVEHVELVKKYVTEAAEVNRDDIIVDQHYPIPAFLYPFTPVPHRLVEKIKQTELPQTPPIKGTPIKATPIKATPTTKPKQKTAAIAIPDTPRKLAKTPEKTYGFLKSLSPHISKNLCHPDALVFRDNFKSNKNELAALLYTLYNENVFDNKLDVPIEWNKKLTNTAGRCSNRKRNYERSSRIELSDKVLTSADRLRCTLIHELCHAATWIFSEENGHGCTWKRWACKANAIFPELPKITTCHAYSIEYKYTYKCTLCGAKSHMHSKSRKVDNIRCAYCHGSIEVFLNKKDKEGNMVPTPVRQASGFAKFVKEKYKVFKTNGATHADVMKILSNKFASLTLEEKKKY